MSYDAPDDDAAPIVAATFIDRESAHDALSKLHRAGFRRVWLGVTRADTPDGDRPRIETENAGSFMEALGRFFSGEESRGHALHEALVTHGLSEAHARRIDDTISPGNAVVVVDGEYDPARAMRILRESGGELESNSSDPRRLDLREERLTIEKERVQAGVDVPAFHEELYVERRPIRGERAGFSATSAGAAEEIPVPSSAERVDVSKHPVVTEEGDIGERRIEGTQNVTDTVRGEELRLDEPTVDAARVPDDAPLSDR